MTADPAFAAFWRSALTAQPGQATRAAATQAPDALAPFLGRPLARALAGGDPEADPEEAAYRRLVHARQGALLSTLRQAGHDVVPLKGLAVAGRLYTPSWIRILGDLDLLVRPEHLRAVAEWLRAEGFTLRTVPQGRLGVTSNVSFHPLVSADGVVQVDLHTAADSYPLSRVLPAETVFRDAVTIDGRALPCATHMATIALSNLAKERFEPRALRQLIDLGRLAVIDPPDWNRVRALAEQAGLGPALNTAIGTLRGLGVAPASLPEMASGHSVVLAGQLLAGRLETSGTLGKLHREATWCYAPWTLLAIWRRRIAGLIHPRSGDPQ